MIEEHIWDVAYAATRRPEPSRVVANSYRDCEHRGQDEQQEQPALARLRRTEARPWRSHNSTGRATAGIFTFPPTRGAAFKCHGRDSSIRNPGCVFNDTLTNGGRLIQVKAGSG